MYKYLNIINQINNAYGATTQSINHFADVLQAIQWDETFQADGEYYFVLGELIVTAQSLNPFNQEWEPSWQVGDAFGSFGN